MTAFRPLLALCALLALAPARPAPAAEADPAAEIRSRIALALESGDSTVQADTVKALRPFAGPEATRWLTAWKEAALHILEVDGKRVAVELDANPDADGRVTARRLRDNQPLSDAAGKPVRVNPDDAEASDTTSPLRRVMKDIVDLSSISVPDPKLRAKAILDIGLQQDGSKRSVLEERKTLEKDPVVIKAIDESLAFMLLRHGTPAEQIAACTMLGARGSIFAQDGLKTAVLEATKAGNKELADAATAALAKIQTHVQRVNAAGTVFRGLSLGSILLIASIGLAITFGLMGVINMAHGELIAVGAYTTYVVQCVFAEGLALSPFGLKIQFPGFNASPSAFGWYFVVALPLSFLMAALVGVALERSVIRFLYRRPLESLLATWGVSLILQQLFRLVFGANNVQVSSPGWLSGNWTVNDVIFGWNRVFVIAFAALIVVLTWAALNKTPLGLLIRSVMQNRDMAACMGVRTGRVNMLTFGLGSGLAGLAGAFLSQIGNVGPSLGQSYIIDAFMTVVVGGVGQLMGTVTSALGIGLVDQSLQQILGNPVLGKILVLGAIILFLQWRPAGLFVTRSRSLD